MAKGKSAYKDISGQKFGHLTAVEMVGINKNRCAIWWCICDCGNEKAVSGKALRDGTIKSCGCTRKTETAEKLKEASTRHGMTDTRLYGIWCGIKSRCYNPNRKKYKDYGAREVTVCPEWRDSFETFRDWALANGYRDDLTIERKDHNGDYCPENCKWATQKEQQNNRRDNHLVTCKGMTQTLQQWADETGIAARTIQQRLKRGWTEEMAVTTPVRRMKK